MENLNWKIIDNYTKLCGNELENKRCFPLLKIIILEVELYLKTFGGFGDSY